MSNNTFRGDRLDYIGSNLKGYAFKVTDYINSTNLTVEFIKTGTKVHTSWRSVTQGKVKDRFEPSVRGVGILGNERSRDNQGVKTKAYAAWECMLQRCYDPKYHKLRPTYKNVSVCEEWLYFKNFKDWYLINSKLNTFVDKDLIKAGNKVYCPEFCSCVPHKINSLLEDAGAARGEYPIGVTSTAKGYKAKLSRKPDEKTLYFYSTSVEDCSHWYVFNKEIYVKRVANEYYKRGLIQQNVYESLLNFKVGR